jgi:hypothetical protein
MLQKKKEFIMKKETKPKGYWTLDRCKEDALSFALKKDWRANSVGYKIAKDKGWVDVCCSHMESTIKPNNYWTLDRCKEDALKFQTRNAWSKEAGYTAAQKKGWLDECCTHMAELKKPNGYWTLDRCKEDSLRFKTRGEWQINSPSYIIASKNKWLKVCCAHMEQLQNPKGYWSLDRCKEDALNYSSRREWSLMSHGYLVAHQNKWLEECCIHMEQLQNPKGYWTFERCKEDALRFKGRTEWFNESGIGYSIAHRNDWIEECCTHMAELKKPNGYWTLDRCKEDALRFQDRSEWRSTGYSVALRNDWIDECCSHMSRAGGTSNPEKELRSIIQETYPTSKSKWFGNKNPKYIQSRFEIDVFVPELNKGIEFNGTYWHSVAGLSRSRRNWPEGKVEQYQEIKEEFFKIRGIEILFIQEKDWNEDKEREIQKCLTFLGA